MELKKKLIKKITKKNILGQAKLIYQIHNISNEIEIT
jgi:hypothetical protein